jgi:hypothetical protein
MKISLRFSLVLLTVWFAISLGATSGFSQYILPNNPGDPLPRDTVAKDSTADSLKTAPLESDSLKAAKPADLEDQENTRSQTTQGEEAKEGAPATSPLDVVRFADTWVRRMFMRGWLDNTHIGAYASYQLTPWQQGMGSYGSVEARITVYYLGQTEYLGKDAEWFQVVCRVMDDQETIIDYDLTVAGSDRVTDFYRVLYRIDHGDLQTGNFTIPEGTLDYDKVDQPNDFDEELVRLYSGSFDTKLFVGSGSAGSVVRAYRTSDVPPLQLVVLAYGDKALTLTSRGADAKPRMDVPPPPSK